MFKELNFISYSKGKSLKDLLVRAKLWRSDNFFTSKCVARRQFLNYIYGDL